MIDIGSLKLVLVMEKFGQVSVWPFFENIHHKFSNIFNLKYQQLLDLHLAQIPLSIRESFSSDFGYQLRKRFYFSINKIYSYQLLKPLKSRIFLGKNVCHLKEHILKLVKKKRFSLNEHIGWDSL